MTRDEKLIWAAAFVHAHHTADVRGAAIYAEAVLLRARRGLLDSDWDGALGARDLLREMLAGDAYTAKAGS